MGLILDFVPNHMGVGFSDNLWWLDVLEWGQKSPHAASFDIDWDGLPHRQQPGVLLPILGRSYADVLSHGEIELKYDAASGTFAAWYFEHKLPINPQRYGEILRNIVSAANAHDTAAGQEMIALAQPHRSPTAPSYRDAPRFKQRTGVDRRRRGTDRARTACLRADSEAASSLCIACWSGNTTTSPIGASPFRPSTTAGFSTSMISPACAPSTPRPSGPCTDWSRG